MVVAAVALAVIVLALFGCKLFQGSGINRLQESPPTAEELMQARLELHRVDRRIELALTKQQQRSEAERVKSQIAEELRP